VTIILCQFVTEIGNEYETTVKIRDGAFGQINCGRELHEWNVRKGKKMILVKTSGGVRGYK
jgi:hypothetical protein